MRRKREKSEKREKDKTNDMSINHTKMLVCFKYVMTGRGFVTVKTCS